MRTIIATICSNITPSALGSDEMLVGTWHNRIELERDTVVSLSVCTIFTWRCHHQTLRVQRIAYHLDQEACL